MENLEKFMKSNNLSRKEEKMLDKLVLGEVKKESRILNIFFKLAVSVVVFLIIGIGINFLPEEQQRNIIKPVSAQEVLQQTFNKIQSLIQQPGILHYKYVVITEHEDIESYDNFEIDVYASTENKKYKAAYIKSRYEGELVDRGLGDGSFQEFPKDEVVIFSDGKNEYSYNDYTENYRNLTPEMLDIEHKGYLSGLLSFYEFLLESDNGQYMLTEEEIEGKNSYVITFDYKGAVMDMHSNGTEYDLLEKIYQAEIIVDKETLLPVLNRTSVKDESFVDTQYEKFTNFELLKSEEASMVFDYKDYMAKARATENPTVYTDFAFGKQITGEIRQINPFEDIVEVNLYDGPKKYDVEGNLLQDRVINKPTIIGKFLSGKTTTLKGFSTKAQYGNIFWIEAIDFSNTHDTSPWITTTPNVTVKPTTSVPDVMQSIEKISSALALFEKTKTLNYTVSGTDGDETSLTHEYEYDIARGVMKVSAKEGSIGDPTNGEQYVYYRTKGKYYLEGDYKTPLGEEDLYITIHDILRTTEKVNDLMNDSRYSASVSYRLDKYEPYKEVEVITLEYKEKQKAGSIVNLFKAYAEVDLEEYRVEALIAKDGKLVQLTIPYVYGGVTYNFNSYDTTLNISVPEIE